jgi:hypothetical protein
MIPPEYVQHHPALGHWHDPPTARPMLNPGALLSSNEFRVDRRANGDASSVMARLRSLARRWSVVDVAELA